MELQSLGDENVFLKNELEIANKRLDETNEKLNYESRNNDATDKKMHVLHELLYQEKVKNNVNKSKFLLMKEFN